MTDTAVHDVVLSGCRPEPLASYLKALGVIRIVTEQKDPEVRGFWRGEHFVLRTALTRDALIRFFIEDWRPTSVIAPWNKGSGFWPSTSDEALRAIEASRDPRLSDYGATIATARRVITELKIVDPPEKGIVKTTLITHLRATVAESALAWLDAAAVLTDADPVYPALLGTGGNDGRQDFSNNFMQRVLTAMSVTDRDALEVSPLRRRISRECEGRIDGPILSVGTVTFQRLGVPFGGRGDNGARRSRHQASRT